MISLEKMNSIHCPLCLQPFKPPIFKCKGGHLACGQCVSELPEKCYQKCVKLVGGFNHEPAMDVVVSAVKVECPYDGCLSLVTYHQVHGHRIACPYGPCACTEPGCDFTASPAVVASHLVNVHSIPVQRLWYGKPSFYLLPCPVSGSPKHLVIGYGDDTSVFARIISAIRQAIVVSLVCVRSAACSQPRYMVKLSAYGLPGPVVTTMADYSPDTVKVVMEPTSCATPGTVALQDLTSFLAVPSVYLTTGRPCK